MTGREKGVHVFAGSYEYDRIVQPLFGEYPVEKIVVLRSDTPYSEMSELADRFADKMEARVPREVETVDLDIYDFDEVFRKTLEILRKYSRENVPVYLNISSAPKLTLVAMISAAYFTRGEGEVEIFYVAPQRYLIPEILEEVGALDGENEGEAIGNLKELEDTFRESGVAVGASDYEVIPLFPIEGINDLDLKILEALERGEAAGSITELVERLDEQSEEEVKRTTVQYRLKKLEEKGLITSRRTERRMEVVIERLGEIYLESSKRGGKPEEEGVTTR